MRMQCVCMHLSRIGYASRAMPQVKDGVVGEWRELMARHARVTAELERELKRRHGLTVTEFEALQRMAEDHADGCRLQALVEDVHLSQSALSRLVARLESEGLVARSSCADDRRGVYTCITEEGRKRLAEAAPTQREVLERTL